MNSWLGLEPPKFANTVRVTHQMDEALPEPKSTAADIVHAWLMSQRWPRSKTEIGKALNLDRRAVVKALDVLLFANRPRCVQEQAKGKSALFAPL